MKPVTKLSSRAFTADAWRSSVTNPSTIAHARFGMGIDADPEVDVAVERAESAIAPFVRDRLRTLWLGVDSEAFG